MDGDAFAQSLTLNGKTIYPPTCPAGGRSCAKVKSVHDGMERVNELGEYHPADSKDMVVLFQSATMGNACNGGPLFFIRFKVDGSYTFSGPIDYCGGPDPKVTATADAVTVTVPAHEPNHGGGKIPESVSE